MPSTAVSYNWFVRITIDHDVVKEKLLIVRGWIDLEQILCLAHVGNNTEKEHIHFCLKMKSLLQKQSLDVRIKKLFGVQGHLYSSKVWDEDDKALSYMFHQDDAPIFLNIGYTAADIKLFYDKNAAIQKVMKVNKARASVKMLDAMVEHFKGQANVQLCDVHRLSLEWIRDGKFYHPGFRLKAYIEECYMRSINGDRFNDYVMGNFRNLFRDY